MNDNIGKYIFYSILALGLVLVCATSGNGEDGTNLALAILFFPVAALVLSIFLKNKKK